MGKYSFKPKRVNGTAGINTLENTSAYSQIAIPNTKLHTQDQDKEQEKLHLLEKLGLFDKIVTHNYLFTLNKASVINISSDKISGMGWYKITKIVLDEDKFFPDQLSMLYTSLHDIALNIALVIQKSNDNIEIYLGARDFNEEVNCEASSLLSSAIHGFLPGIGTEYAVDKKFISSDNKLCVASYSGVASLRDDKKENFIQGIEKFLDSTQNIPTYTAIFIADNVSQEQAQNMIGAFSQLHDSIKPFCEIQETINESQTHGVSETLTKTIGQTITNTISETVTHTEGTNQSYSKSIGTAINKGSNLSPNILKSLWRGIVGGEVGTNSGVTENEQVTDQAGSHIDNAKADGKSQAKGKSESDTRTLANSSNTTSGYSRQITKSSRIAKNYIDLLDRRIERLRTGIPYGLWSIGTYFVSHTESTSRKLANIYKGCVTGEESDLDASAVNVWSEEQSKALMKYLQQSQNPRFLVDGINVSAGELVTSKELAIHMSLPQTSVPGVEVRSCVSFGRNLNEKCKKGNVKDSSLKIGKISHLGNVSVNDVALDIDEIGRHVFVTGSTGSGKSNTVYLLINELLKRKKKVLVIEPTKGDYRKVFGGRKDMTVFSTRENEKNIIRINPFAFPEGIFVVEHVERLVEIFGVCWPMYAAMPAVLKDSILSAYKACGWNLKTSQCSHGRLFPTISDVVVELKKIIKSSQYSSDTKGDYIGALQTRLESLTNGSYASIFSSSDVHFADLYDKNAIIDLHYIGSSETRALLMGLLVLGLTEWRMVQNEDDMDKALQHVTVLEEAHCILPRVSKNQSQEGSNMVGKSVEMIASAIAEMRTYGESFIIVDQSPSAVDEAAIRNTNTKIVMNLPDGEDREIAGKSMALVKDSQIDELARLTTGEAVVWQRGWSEAILTQIDYMSDKHPLAHKDMIVQIYEEDTYHPSELLINYFLGCKTSINDLEKEAIRNEIIFAPSLSTIKSSLLDSLEGKGKQTVESLLVFFNIKKKLFTLLDAYPQGSINITKELRKYLENELGISDSLKQNILIGAAYEWGSRRNPKLHSVFLNCIPSKNIN